MHDACHSLTERYCCQNDEIIVALLVVMRRLCGAIVIADLFSLCVVAQALVYFLRTHIAMQSDSCQASFGVKLYQRMLK
jgi:hypothetical protein